MKSLSNSKRQCILANEGKKIYSVNMGDDIDRVVSEIRTGITRNDWAENAVAKYMIETRRNTKQLSMNPWLAYHLFFATVDTTELSEIENLDILSGCICQLRSQIEAMLVAAESRGLDVPLSLYGRSDTLGKAKPEKKAKTMKPKSSPQPKVEEDDDYTFQIAPGLTLDFSS